MTATQMGAAPETTQEKAKAVADQAAGKAGEVASSTAADAKALVSDAKSEALAVAGEAKEKARDLASDARQQLRQQADEQAGRAGAAMRELSGQLSAMADAADGGFVPDLARQASSTIDGLAGRLDAGGLDAVVADVKRYARNKPGTFLLGAAAVGLLAGRLTRSVDAHALADAAKPASDDPAPSSSGSATTALDLTGSTPQPSTPSSAALPLLPVVAEADRPLRAPGH
jgi:hypothetical protein